jgi:ankyrin repeat protein
LFFFLFSGAGGDASIQDEGRKTPLHRLGVLSHDVRLFKLLCENGANINALDIRGNSPLLSLCDLSASEMYDYMEDLSPCSNDTLEDTSASLCVKRDFFNYLLKQKNIQVKKRMLDCRVSNILMIND